VETFKTRGQNKDNGDTKKQKDQSTQPTGKKCKKTHGRPLKNSQPEASQKPKR